MSHDQLSTGELQLLVDVAEQSIRLAVIERKVWVPEPAAYPLALRVPGAAFVTLRQAGRLMGCIGTLAATSPLVITVADRSRAAALADPRFVNIRPDDVADLDVSISVLSAMVPLEVAGYEELLACVRPGVDGLLVEAGRLGATFLPSVWDELREPAVFVEALWRKARLVPRAWPAGTRVSRYTAQHRG